MGLWSCLFAFMHRKNTALLNWAEDPRQTLDYAHEKQQELLERVRRGQVEVATRQPQLEQLRERLTNGLIRTEGQAWRAFAAGREGLARTALSRIQAAVAEIAALEAQPATPEAVRFASDEAVGVSEEDIRRLTEEALRRLHNTEALTRCGLIELLPLSLAAARASWTDSKPAGATPLAQGRALREVLEAAIQRMEPAGGNGALQYHILHEEYVLGWSNKWIITRHEIPDVTFYRHRREGILVLARELKNQENVFAEVGRRR